MTPRRTMLAALAGLAAPAPALQAQEASLVPEEVRTAETSLAAWLDSLQGLSRPALEQKLGKPTEEKTWESAAGTEPVLAYRTPGGASLEAYFDRASGKALVVQYCLRK